MAERDMTGRERSALDAGPTSDAATDPARDLDTDVDAEGSDGLAADLARPRSELSGGIGRLGAPAGLGGDLANLPPWSARAERVRPDRDPAALAAWRRVAERRRLRSGGGEPALPAPASAPEAPSPSPSPSDGADERDADAPLAVLGFGPAGEEPATGDPTTGDPTIDEPTAEETTADGPTAGGPTAEEPPMDEPLPREPAVDDVRADEVTVDEVAVDEVADDGADPGSFGVHAPEPRAHDRASDPMRSPRERPAGPPPSTGGPEGRDRGRREHDGPGGRHEVLLALAGRLDDDALSSVRELVAVEDDAAAAELLGGSLLAADVGVTPRELAVLDQWFAAARVDPELVEVLRHDPEADRRLEHRFVADPPSGAASDGNDGPGEVIARAASRLPGVRHVRQCWRTTPAGASPGPVPHRVVLVETHSADDCEHVAHHVAHAARELGAVSVEVFATDAELPPYHRAAAASARPLGTASAAVAAPARATRPAVPSGALPVLPARLRTATGGPGHSPQGPLAPVPPFGVAGGGVDDLVTDRPDTTPHGRMASDEEFRTVADAGHDRTSEPEARVAERGGFGRGAVPDLAPEIPDDEPIDQLLDDELSDDDLRAAELRDDEPEPRFDDRAAGIHDQRLEPERPDPVDLDPETTAERIAALWRRPVSEGDTADETDRSVAGPSVPLGRGTDDGPRYRHAGPETDPDDVDPTAPTGDLSVAELGAEGRRASNVNGHHLADHAPYGHRSADGDDADREDDRPDRHEEDPGRVPRARHSRGGGHDGAAEADGAGRDPRDGGPPAAPDAHRGGAAWSEAPAASTNGHRHAPDAGSSIDPATGPVTWSAEPAPSGPRPEPATDLTAAEITGPAEAVSADGAPTRPSGPSHDDSVDSQLSERERELLARLHDELASRERLEAGAPDPLLGRRGPGVEGAPGGPPPPGYRAGPGTPPGPPPGPAPGYANGHGLPPRPDPYPEDD